MYPFLNGVVGSSTPTVKFSLVDRIKLTRYVRSQEPTYRKVGSKPHPVPRRFLYTVRPTGSNSRRIPTLVTYLFIRMWMPFEISDNVYSTNHILKIGLGIIMLFIMLLVFFWFSFEFIVKILSTCNVFTCDL